MSQCVNFSGACAILLIRSFSWIAIFPVNGHKARFFVTLLCYLQVGYLCHTFLRWWLLHVQHLTYCCFHLLPEKRKITSVYFLVLWLLCTDKFTFILSRTDKKRHFGNSTNFNLPWSVKGRTFVPEFCIFLLQSQHYIHLETHNIAWAWFLFALPRMGCLKSITTEKWHV